MRAINPAILEKDFGEIKNKLTFLRGRVKCAHIDIQDGIFTETSTWPFTTGGFDDFDFRKIINEEEGMPYWNDLDFEFDLMVSDAVEKFDTYMKLGPKRMIFHLSAQKSVEEFENFLESIDMYVRDNTEIGLAFKPDDDLNLVSRLSHKVDFLHCMGSNHIGIQGEKFSDKALENIKSLKKELPGIVISVDIGITLQNAEVILEAGADRLCVGSAIWKSSDPIGALENFQSLI